MSLVHALRELGRDAEARALCDDSLALAPWHPLALAARGRLRLDVGRAAEAVTDLEAACVRLPAEPELRTLLAEARLAADATPEAREQALDALATLRRDGTPEAYRRAVQTMLSRDPLLLGALVTRAGRTAETAKDDAAALVLAAASVASEDAGFLDQASEVLVRTGRADEARTLTGRALGVRAAEALARGDATAALRLAGKAVLRDPRPAHHLTAARALTRLGETRAAVEEIGAAVAAGRVDPDAVRADPALAALFPDARLEDVLDRAAKRAR